MRDATSAAVVSDLVEIARELAAEHKPAGWYLRLTVYDEPAIIARVAEILSREGMTIDSVQQEPHSPKTRLSLFFTVEPLSEPKVRSAIEKINAFEFRVEPVLLLRIE